MAEKGKKAPYRALTIPERDMLFAFYEKHNGNALAMTRDRGCVYRSKNQIYYYKELYGFDAEFIQNRAEMAKKVIESLGDTKIRALRRAADLVEIKQILIKNPITGDPILDQDGQPVFAEKKPSAKEIKTAWEIIKTELGEPTSVTNSQLSGLGGKPIEIIGNQIAFTDFNSKKEDQDNDSAGQ